MASLTTMVLRQIWMTNSKQASPLTNCKIFLKLFYFFFLLFPHLWNRAVIRIQWVYKYKLKLWPQTLNISLPAFNSKVGTWDIRCRYEILEQCVLVSLPPPLLPPWHTLESPTPPPLCNTPHQSLWSLPSSLTWMFLSASLLQSSAFSSDFLNTCFPKASSSPFSLNISHVLLQWMIPFLQHVPCLQT